MIVSARPQYEMNAQRVLLIVDNLRVTISTDEARRLADDLLYSLGDLDE